ncbi:hypothetical protein [uncultured Bradyrhizobium sp.]|uniref:hypothetical protein n=1 Tax=uncultured Bradyrhizobium sp. TaxID=199684 RepID=UPI002636731C|nr:hypothetical protein [uncultured Bradyrhizobium sp.]
MPDVNSEVGLLQVAWSASSEPARRKFLAELFRDVVRPATTRRGGVVVADALSSFFDDSLVRGSSADRIQASILYAAYVRWCDVRGEAPLSARRFALHLKERGIKRLHSNVRWWIGLRFADRKASDAAR